MTQQSSPPAGGPQTDLFPELRDFSLVLCGPLYQLLRRAHLEGDAAQHVRRRLAVLCGLIWLPLFVLCAIEGTLAGGVAIPFLADIETHARFLLAAPLLIAAELLVHLRMRGIVAQFVERNLVPAAALERFRTAIRSAMAWRNSIAGLS